MPKIALLCSGDPVLPQGLQDPRILPLPDDVLAHPHALDRYRAILIGMHADQRWLRRHQASLEAFLDAGNTVVVSGQIATPFLEDLRPFEVLDPMTLERLEIEIAVPDHPIFVGVEPDDLTKRRGVAGFYGLGGHRPPAGAQVLTTLAAGVLALDWLVTRPSGGRLLVHAGNDLWSYAAFGDAESTATRLAPQLLDWLSAA
ncbi:MAG: hypothetical protein AAFY56_23640 [Pseudomonadota bacterium]